MISAVLFSGGLDSAVLVAEEAARGDVQPIYVSAGLAWEAAELAFAAAWLTSRPRSPHVRPLASLAVDMRDVYQESERRVGSPIDLATKSTYNPKTKKYFAFSPSFTPDPVNWREDLFSQVGLPKGPTTWDEVRSAGKKIRQQFDTPVAIYDRP